MRRRTLGAFADILRAPQWAQVRVVKRLLLLRHSAQVKFSERYVVIDVPLADVLPGHALQETRFEVAAQELNVAADEFKNAVTFG